MNDNARQAAALQVIVDLRDQLVELTNIAQRSGDATTGYETLRRWKDRACRKIEESISPIEGKRLATKRKMSFTMGDPVGNLTDEAKMYEGYLIALGQEIEKHPDDVLNRPVTSAEGGPPQIEVPKPKGSAIFIVHGHDELNLYRLRNR